MNRELNFNDSVNFHGIFDNFDCFISFIINDQFLDVMSTMINQSFAKLS